MECRFLPGQGLETVECRFVTGSGDAVGGMQIFPKRYLSGCIKVNRVTCGHVYVGGWAGVGACPAVEGRQPGRIRRRPARGPLLELLYQLLCARSGPDTQCFRMAGVWILFTPNFSGNRGLDFNYIEFRGFCRKKACRFSRKKENEL